MTTAGTSRLLGRLDLPAQVTAARCARRYVGDLLRAADHPATGDAELLVTELVANAVRHSDSRRTDGMVRVAVIDRGGVIRIEVTDDGSATSTPRLHPPTDDAEGGRGLLLVQALAARWGHYRQNSGRTVWCELPTEPPRH